MFGRLAGHGFVPAILPKAPSRRKLEENPAANDTLSMNLNIHVS
jgi:hypothetical protein